MTNESVTTFEGTDVRSVEGDLVTMAWKPDACEEPKGPRRERRAAKAKARRAR